VAEVYFNLEKEKRRICARNVLVSLSSVSLTKEKSTAFQLNMKLEAISKENH